MTPDQLEARNKAVDLQMRALNPPVELKKSIKLALEVVWLEGWIKGANELKGIEKNLDTFNKT